MLGRVLERGWQNWWELCCRMRVDNPSEPRPVPRARRHPRGWTSLEPPFVETCFPRNTDWRRSPKSHRSKVNQWRLAGWQTSYSTDLQATYAVSKRAWNRESRAPSEFRDRGRIPIASVTIAWLSTRHLFQSLRLRTYAAVRRQPVDWRIHQQPYPGQREEVFLYGPLLLERG
jgi:hypothetical protein